MVMIGYFVGITSERGIAWRCADSFSVKTLLGVGPADATPHHSGMSRIRHRLTNDVFTVFDRLIHGILKDAGLVQGETRALDSTTAAANASIVRKDTKTAALRWPARLSTSWTSTPASSSRRRTNDDGCPEYGRKCRSLVCHTL